MTNSTDQPMIVAAPNGSDSAYRVPVGAGGLSENESREIICHNSVADDKYEAILARSPDESETIPLFVFEAGTFAYTYALPVTNQEEMTPNYPVEHIPLPRRNWHLAVAATGSVGVVVQYESSVPTTLDLSSIPEAPQPESETALIVVFDSDGTPVFTKPFVSGISDFDISQDGEYLAVLTAFPDIATYLYTTDGQYLGSALGQGTEQYCSLVHREGQDPEVKVTGSNMSSTALAVEGDEFGAVMPGDTRLLQDTANGPIHIIMPTSLPDSSTNLRLPDIEVESACGVNITPLDSYLVFDSQREADRAEASLCADCSNNVGPAEKFEERLHEM